MVRLDVTEIDQAKVATAKVGFEHVAGIEVVVHFPAAMKFQEKIEKHRPVCLG